MPAQPAECCGQNTGMIGTMDNAEQWMQAEHWDEAGPRTTVVELGAGKGLLARTLVETCESVDCLLVDTRAPAATYDGPRTHRIQEAVAHCDIDMHVTHGPDSDPRVVVLAKHLCHNGTDQGIEAICRSKAVGAVLMAPCCHPQIQWEQYANTAFLSQAGITPQDLGIMLKLMVLGKYKSIKDRDCRKWTHLKALGEERIRRLADLSRRVIEEGRIRVLKSQGFKVNLIQYADPSVTPDNLMIMGCRGNMSDCKIPCSSGESGPQFSLPSQGCFMHPNGAGQNQPGLPDRIVDYLIERKAHNLHMLQSASVFQLQSSSNSKPKTLVLVRSGDMLGLLDELKQDRVLARVTDMILPFNGWCDAPEQVGGLIHQMTDSDVFPLRVFNFPSAFTGIIHQPYKEPLSVNTSID